MLRSTQNVFFSSFLFLKNIFFTFFPSFRCDDRRGVSWKNRAADTFPLFVIKNSARTITQQWRSRKIWKRRTQGADQGRVEARTRPSKREIPDWQTCHLGNRPVTIIEGRPFQPAGSNIFFFQQRSRFDADAEWDLMHLRDDCHFGWLFGSLNPCIRSLRWQITNFVISTGTGLAAEQVAMGGPHHNEYSNK